MYLKCCTFTVNSLLYIAKRGKYYMAELIYILNLISLSINWHKLFLMETIINIH